MPQTKQSKTTKIAMLCALWASVASAEIFAPSSTFLQARPTLEFALDPASSVGPFFIEHIKTGGFLAGG